MRKIFKIFILLSVTVNIAFSTTYSYPSGVIAKDNVTAQQLANAIQGTGITISNPVITHGSGKQVGIFSNGYKAGLEINSGIILTGMNVQESFTTNNSWYTSKEESGIYYDSDLMSIDNRAYYNPVIFEFDVTLDKNTRLLLIDYQFASEEYNEYVGSQFNDAFGFFVSGGDLNATYNIARVVDSNTYVTVNNLANYAPVAVNNVNNGSVGYYNDSTPEILTNSKYFINNCNKYTGEPLCTQNSSPIQIEYDGITHTLHATLDNLTPGQTYHFKLAIADTSDALWDTGVFIHKINGLREPSLCYDYSYKQNGQYFTQEYNSTIGPMLKGDVIANDPNSPIDVSFYLKNTKQSDLQVSNVTFNIIDINTTQATYKPNTVYITQPGDAFKTKISDTVLDVNNSYIKNVPINSFNAFEYFYVYYSLDPKTSSINMPLNAKIDYDLILPLSKNDIVTVHRTSFIDGGVPLCSGGNFNYFPAKGIFNVVNQNYQTSSLSTGFFDNLPTQIVNRMGNFKVLSLDPNNLDIPKPVSTVVAVDMVDASAYHDTNASCQEISNSLTDRVWVVFENNSTIADFSANSGIPNSFFKKARKNAAFRITYNLTNDGNNDLVKIEKTNTGKYKILNFPQLVQNIGSCKRPVRNPSNPSQTTTNVSVACGNAGNAGITKDNLDICMECVFGYKTKVVCSRDNFSIRPEAFKISFEDQNQTDKNSTSGITSNYSGVVGATAPRLNLSAGYDYKLNITAVAHDSNNPSVGYTRSFDSSYTLDTAMYQWETNSSLNCNDTNDKILTITFGDGRYSGETTINQVGKYTLKLEDTTWTDVDHNTTYMSHHTGSFFKSGSDCVENSSGTVLATALGLNGCNISSNHLNPENNYQYNDIPVEFRPYKFLVSGITTSVGKNFTSTSSLSPLFVYNNDVTKDNNMSLHFKGTIEAKGYNDTSLTNFTDGCYAKPVKITLKKSNTTHQDVDGNPLKLKARVIAYDQNSTALANKVDVIDGGGTSDIVLNLPTSYFVKQLNGRIDSYLKVNYDRNITKAAEPKKVRFLTYKVDCQNENECSSNADLGTKKPKGEKKYTNFDVWFLYAKSYAPRTVINGNEGDVPIEYDVYCTTNCSAIGFLQATVDSRWWKNTQHNSNYGKADSKGSIVQRNGANAVRVVPGYGPTGVVNDNVRLHYYGSSYPYKTTMQMFGDDWLIYNKYSSTDVGGNVINYNEFEVQFNNNSAGWVGSGESNNTTQQDTSQVKRVLSW